MKINKSHCTILRYFMIFGFILLNILDLKSQDFQEITEKLNGKYDLPCYQFDSEPDVLECSIEEGFTKIKIDPISGKGFMSENTDGVPAQIWDVQLFQKGESFGIYLESNNSTEEGLIVELMNNQFTLKFSDKKFTKIFYPK